MRKRIMQVLKCLLRTVESKDVRIDVKLLDDNSQLSNVYAIITGGAKGIGKAISKKIISSGGKVIITGRDDTALKDVCQELGKNVNFLKFDSTDFGKYDFFFDKALDLLPEVNALILNAGISLHEGSFEDVTFQSFDIQFDTNLKANYFLAQKYIAKVRKGNIIFISSETADMKCLLPYGLTKAAMSSFVAALSCKYYKENIRVNAVAPGITMTDMVNSNHKKTSNYYFHNIAERYFLPEEVAETVAFLLSDVSKCISGEIIHTNAGNHYRPQ